MKLFSLILHLLFLEQCYPSVLLSGGPYCDDGSNTVQHAVPGTTVSVSCSVDNPNDVLNVLSWTIPSDNISVANINGANGADIDRPEYVSTVTSFDNTEATTSATLSFPAMSELNGTVVNCADVSNAVSSCTLFIMTLPSAPINLGCTDVTTNSITFVWDAPVDNGGDTADVYYEVTRTPGDTIIVTSSTSIIEMGLIARSNYTFSIKANNSVGYSDSQSVVCRTRGEVFNQLSADDLEVCLGSNETHNYLIVNITTQDCPPVSPNPATTPAFDNFTITVSGFNSVSKLDCMYEQLIIEENNYDITVTINNEEGSSEPTTTQFDSRWIREIDVDLEDDEISYSTPDCTIFTGDHPLVFLNITNATGDDIYNDEQPYGTFFNITTLTINQSPRLYNYSLLVTVSDRTIASYTGPLAPAVIPTSATTATGSASSMDRNTPSGSDTSSAVSPSVKAVGSDIPVAAIAGGAAGGVIVILIVVIIIIVMGCLLCNKKKHSVNLIGSTKGGDKDGPIPLKETKQAQPETGQGLYQDPNTIERQKAPTGDLYALPDKSNKRRPPPQPEMPTYQDPNTIQRQQAPTGDLYSLPEKKPMYSQVNKDLKNSGGGNYADLELVSAGPRSPSNQPLISPTTHQSGSHKPVIYSDVHGFKSH